MCAPYKDGLVINFDRGNFNKEVFFKNFNLNATPVHYAYKISPSDLYVRTGPLKMLVVCPCFQISQTIYNEKIHLSFIVCSLVHMYFILSTTNYYSIPVFLWMYWIYYNLLVYSINRFKRLIISVEEQKWCGCAMGGYSL